MAGFGERHPARLRAAQAAGLAVAACAFAAPAAAQGTAPAPDGGWQACQALRDDRQRLACFDSWTARARGAATGASASAQPQSVAPASTPPSAVPGMALTPSTTLAAAAPPSSSAETKPPDDCHDEKYTHLMRYWELRRESSCGIFALRGYRPTTLALVAADTVNTMPTSSAPGRSALTSEPYRTVETRLQVSLRTKLAENLLTAGSGKQDSLWLAYTQQSYWQLFTSRLSRPFRSTDHEPELFYVYPISVERDKADDPPQWRLRYAGVGLSHQSNGQDLPLSRSWNRAFVMLGAERGPVRLQARFWDRLGGESGGDDNPGIQRYIGRGELSGAWDVGRATLGFTARNSFSGPARGSLRLEWLQGFGSKVAFGRYVNDLRFHAQLFTGYGDSLIDYNRKRNVVSLGFSLVDW